MEFYSELSSLGFWSLALFVAVLISIGNVARWTNVVHPVLHGAYDKVPNIPKQYTKKYFAQGYRRYWDWLDWIQPDAWSYEHNIMHHYHLGELDDPDCIERNTPWLRSEKTSKPLKYLVLFLLMITWKLTYYAPNTLRVLNNKKHKEETSFKEISWSLTSERGRELWKEAILPYAVVKLILIPLLFLPFGVTAVLSALAIILIAEALSNLYSFVLIIPSHSAEDIYMFDEPHKDQSEFYLRQIMGSVNYNTGGNMRDFLHGWLNYQIEHHLFPNLSLSQYQKLQPQVKALCEKHQIEYRQESVFTRLKKSIDIFVGKSEMIKINAL